jgi:hypothetical protein
MNEKPFTWRMQQQHPEQQRKYQLFPKERQLPVLNSTKNVDPEKAFALAMQTAEKHERPSAAAGLRIRVNQHQFSSRRRKVSVAETGHMTTVQEIPMDSRMLITCSTDSQLAMLTWKKQPSPTEQRQQFRAVLPFMSGPPVLLVAVETLASLPIPS